MSENQQKPKQSLITALTIALLRGTIKLLKGIVKKLEAAPVTQSAPVVESSTATIEQDISDTREPAMVTSTSDIPTATPETSDIPTTTPETSDLPTTAPETSDIPTTAPETSDLPTTAPETSALPTATPETSDISTTAPETSALPTATPETTKEVVNDWVSPPQNTKLTDRLLPSFNSLQTFWDGLLAKVRSLFPASWNEKLSDWGLTAAIATIVVAVLLTTVALLPPAPAQEAKAPSTTIAAPPELTAPEQPQAVAVEAPPPPVLTPEQSLISAIQNQVAAIMEEYGEGLIKAIQANFLESRLIVKVSDSWYKLEAQQQDKLADQILTQAIKLDFSQLEINDLEGNLIARNPVVGIHTVILRR
ncbi:MAG: hypothetical protein F6K31_37810 [Symploca sp. SIO2G7]|nr:hypothetical protein [Symploca sp. SIO2G7]